jgi:hypothetical protein
MATKYLSGAHVTEGEMARLPSDWLGSAWSRLAAWLDTCADHWAAAAMYQQLSALSDAELARRGLSRATLAHDLRTACVRNPEQSG